MKEHRSSPLLRNLDLTFIQKGVPRLDTAAKVETFSVVLRGISQDFEVSWDFASEIFNLFLRLLQDYQIPLRGSPQDIALRDNLGISDDDAKFISLWIGKLMLLRSVRSTESIGESNPPCPGLTTEEFKFLSLHGKRDAFDASAANGIGLTATKLKAAKLLGSGLFRDQERFIPALCASSIPNSDVASVADEILKRASPAVDLNDAEGLRTLFMLFTFRFVQIHFSILRLSVLTELQTPWRTGRDAADPTEDQDLVIPHEIISDCG